MLQLMIKLADLMQPCNFFRFIYTLPAQREAIADFDFPLQMRNHLRFLPYREC